LEETRRQFGRLKTALFRLHTFEEPFYSRESLETLTGPTHFKQGQTKLVGLLCCLVLKRSG
jgi:hypothetical protein